MDRRAALAHAFRSCRYAPHRSVPFAGAQLAVPKIQRSAAGSFALPLAVALYGAPDCSEFPFEWLSISRRSAAKESSDQGSAAPPGRPYVNLRGNIFTLIEEAQRRRSEEHTSELQSPCNLVCRLLLEKKKQKILRIGIFLHTHLHTSGNSF